MTVTRPCLICGEQVEGRKDKQCCSPECAQERKRRYDRARYPEIRDETIKRACDYQRENFEWKQRYDRDYRATKRDPEKHGQWGKEFRKLNPEYGRMAAHKRRARKLAGGSFQVTIEDLWRLRLAYGDRCAYCSGEFTEINPLEWDHVVPLSRGGWHSIGNLAPSCKRCNRSKAHKLVIEWRTGAFIRKPRAKAVAA